MDFTHREKRSTLKNLQNFLNLKETPPSLSERQLLFFSVKEATSFFHQIT